MDDNKKGHLIFIAALGVMCSLVAKDVADLSGWHEITQPAFVASVLIHIGTVIGAFLGGRLIQEKK